MIILPFLLLIGLVLALDPYNILGVSRDADEKTIKSAYRQLSKQYHPDKNPAKDAHDKFIEVGQAYEILSDPQKKRNFDQFGNADGPGGFGGPGGGGGGFDFGDIFGQFFGGHGGPGGPGGGGGVRRGPDTQVTISMSLKDAFLGKDFGFDVEMNNICTTCLGSGSADGKKHVCDKCGGAGQILITRQMGPMIQRIQTVCDKCKGSGSSIANPCKNCHGKGTERAGRHYNVYISPGTPRNHHHVLEGEGDQSPEFVPGNMNLIFTEDDRESWGFRRIKDNLYRTEVLTAKEAMAGGWSHDIKFFDNETLTLKRAKGVAVMDGEVEVFKGHGMPVLNDEREFGNLFVEYRVVPMGGVATKDEL